MFISDGMQPGRELYTVQIKEFAERYFIKKFKKKYKGAWGITYTAIKSMLERIDILLRNQDSRVYPPILTNGQHKIVKVEFSVAGTNQSAKSSGNRLIVWVNEETRTSLILLAYSKNDISTHNETQEWKKIVKENYPELKSIFRL